MLSIEEIKLLIEKLERVKEEDFKKKIRKFYKSSQTPKEWAHDLSLKIKENYCWKKITQAYDNALAEIID